MSARRDRRDRSADWSWRLSDLLTLAERDSEWVAKVLVLGRRLVALDMERSDVLADLAALGITDDTTGDEPLGGEAARLVSSFIVDEYITGLTASGDPPCVP